MDSFDCFRIDLFFPLCFRSITTRLAHQTRFDKINEVHILRESIVCVHRMQATLSCSMFMLYDSKVQCGAHMHTESDIKYRRYEVGDKKATLAIKWRINQFQLHVTEYNRLSWIPCTMWNGYCNTNWTILFRYRKDHFKFKITIFIFLSLFHVLIFFSFLFHFFRDDRYSRIPCTNTFHQSVRSQSEYCF